MKKKTPLLIDGMTAEELLEWSVSPESQAIIFADEPVIFRAGSSEILRQFARDDTNMRIVLSHIEGGGEGVLLRLMNVFRAFAARHQLQEIEWIVHAVDCPRPNPKLPPILERRGFRIVTDPVDGLVYAKVEKAPW